MGCSELPATKIVNCNDGDIACSVSIIAIDIQGMRNDSFCEINSDYYALSDDLDFCMLNEDFILSSDLCVFNGMLHTAGPLEAGRHTFFFFPCGL